MTRAALSLFGLVVWAGLSVPALGQGAGESPGESQGQATVEAPMSAIDWLSESLNAASPAPVPTGQAASQTATLSAPLNEPPVSGSTVSQIAIGPIGGTSADAIGILSPQLTGLPRTLWGASKTQDLTRRIAQERPDMLPALQGLLQKVLLAELDPPAGSSGEAVFLARVDKLLDMGALDQAYALLERAGALSPEITRRWFDVALLIGQEDKLCEIMLDSPDLTPTYTARVFCMARAEDWDGAVLMLNNARALGLVDAAEDDLLAWFLDPELFDGEPYLPLPDPLTPLKFRLFEAIGQPISTASLPLAFVQSDLRDNTGWKAQLAAGERLARTGAVSDNQLLGLYTERKAAASGGVWDRVMVVQALELALKSKRKAEIAEVLPQVWQALSYAEVEVPISRIHGAELARMRLGGAAGDIAYRMGLLTDEYEIIARDYAVSGEMAQFLAGVAQGALAGVTPPSEAARAVADGFGATTTPARFQPLIEGDRLGEAILSALTLFTTGARGDFGKVSDAIALLRAVGLEGTARRASLEYLILDRRG
ncbi:MAG: hypothetical protein ACRBCL_10630 [Maritimibacter sp.]